MKNFKQFLNEVAAARSQSDKEAMAMHQIHVVDPVGYGKQLPNNKKTPPRLADPKGNTREGAAVKKSTREERPEKKIDTKTGNFWLGDSADDDDEDDHPDRVNDTSGGQDYTIPEAFQPLFFENAVLDDDLKSLWDAHARTSAAKNSSAAERANEIYERVKQKHGQNIADGMRAHSVCHHLGLHAMCEQLRKEHLKEESLFELETHDEHEKARAKAGLNSRPKLDELSNLWYVYARNHTAEPYTKAHDDHNKNIYDFVYRKYGKETADDMHHHAHAYQEGNIAGLRKKHGIMESIQEMLEADLKESEFKSVGFIDDAKRKEMTKGAHCLGKEPSTGEHLYVHHGRNQTFSVKKVGQNKHQLRLHEEIEPKNKGYGFLGALGGKAESYLDRATAAVRKETGWNDEKINHYLDSSHGKSLGEALLNNHSPAKIARSLRHNVRIFDANYNPAYFKSLSEEEQLEERSTIGDLDTWHHHGDRFEHRKDNYSGGYAITKSGQKHVLTFWHAHGSEKPFDHLGRFDSAEAAVKAARRHDGKRLSEAEIPEGDAYKYHSEMANHHYHEKNKTFDTMMKDAAFRKAHHEFVSARYDQPDFNEKHEAFIKARDAHPLANRLKHHEREFHHHQSMYNDFIKESENLDETSYTALHIEHSRLKNHLVNHKDKEISNIFASPSGYIHKNGHQFIGDDENGKVGVTYTKPKAGIQHHAVTVTFRKPLGLGMKETFPHHVVGTADNAQNAIDQALAKYQRSRGPLQAVHEEVLDETTQKNEKHIKGLKAAIQNHQGLTHLFGKNPKIEYKGLSAKTGAHKYVIDTESAYLKHFVHLHKDQKPVYKTSIYVKHPGKKEVISTIVHAALTHGNSVNNAYEDYKNQLHRNSLKEEEVLDETTQTRKDDKNKIAKDKKVETCHNCGWSSDRLPHHTHPFSELNNCPRCNSFLHEETLEEARKGLPSLKNWNRHQSGDIDAYSHQHGGNVIVIAKNKQGSHTASVHFQDKPSLQVGDFDTPEKAHAAIKKSNKLYHFYEQAICETPAGVPVPGAASKEGALKYVKQVEGKWALVSRHTGKPLRYYHGSGKPPADWATKALRGIEFFKHGGAVSEEVLDESSGKLPWETHPFYQRNFKDSEWSPGHAYSGNHHVHSVVRNGTRHELHVIHHGHHKFSASIYSMSLHNRANLSGESSGHYKDSHKAIDAALKDYHRNRKVDMLESTQLDELSPETLKNYIKRAADKGMQHSYIAGRFHQQHVCATGLKKKDKQKNFDKAVKRLRGVRKAADKLADRFSHGYFDEEQLDELSPQTLSNYAFRSSRDIAHHAHDMGFVNGIASTVGTDAEERAAREKHNAKQLKRQVGLHKALQKLVKKSSLKEAVAVDRYSYELAHGKQPRGEGSWFIGLGQHHIDFTKHKEGEHYITHNGKLSDAVKKAKEIAKQKGHHTVFVLS